MPLYTRLDPVLRARPRTRQQERSMRGEVGNAHCCPVPVAAGCTSRVPSCRRAAQGIEPTSATHATPKTRSASARRCASRSDHPCTRSASANSSGWWAVTRATRAQVRTAGPPRLDASRLIEGSASARPSAGWHDRPNGCMRNTSATRSMAASLRYSITKPSGRRWPTGYRACRTAAAKSSWCAAHPPRPLQAARGRRE